MADDERAIEVDGVSFGIPLASVDAMLKGEGVDLRLSGLNVRLTEAALNAILKRYAPPGGSMQAKVSANGVTFDRKDTKRTFHFDVAARGIRVSLADGQLRVESE